MANATSIPLNPERLQIMIKNDTFGDSTIQMHLLGLYGSVITAGAAVGGALLAPGLHLDIIGKLKKTRDLQKSKKKNLML